MKIPSFGWRRLIAYSALLGAAAPAAAATQDGKFAVEGPGQAACSRVLQARETKPQEFDRYIGFVEGYLSAANRYEPNTFDLTPWHSPQALSLILTTHCEKNPSDLLGVVVQQLVAAMLPLRLATYSTVERIEAGGNRAEVYEAVLKRAQDALVRRGLYSGPADGHFSSGMQQALLRFQESENLDPTGVPDVATLWTLLNP